MSLKDIREKQQKLVADARAKMDEIKDDTPAARATEIETEYDAIMAEYDTLEGQASALEAREARRDQLEQRAAHLNRPDPRRPGADPVIAPAADDDDKVVAARRRAFEFYLRHGREALSPEQRALLVRDGEVRAQGVDVGSQGGYLAPAGFMAELIRSLKAWGPMMDEGIVRVLNTANGNAISMPTMDDTSNTGAQIPENTQVSTAEVAFGLKTLDAYKYTSGVVLVSDELLQDSVLDVGSIVNSAMSERISRIGNTDLTTGSGASTPNGVATAAAAGYTAASATAIVFDDLIELEHAVDPAYRTVGTCRWMFNDSTLKAIRKLKDGEGRYIWQPADVKAGAPATLLNYGYAINQAVAAIGTGNRSVLFGDFKKYIVRMVNTFAIKRLVERYADYGQVGFIGFTRFDGELMDTAAVKRLTHP